MTDLYNVDEIESALENLSVAFPALCTVLTLPHQTAEGRTSHALKISSNPGAMRPAILMTGGMHGREWGLADTLLGFGRNLLEAYATDQGLQYGNKTFPAAQIKAAVDASDIVIFPMVNPDGYAYSRAHDQAVIAGWRKNRSTHFADTAKIGVDLARNFDFLWDFDSKMGRGEPPASTNPSDNDYHGTGPFSEPESRNVKWLLDNAPETRWYIDLHSPSGTILYSWGDDQNQAKEPTQNFRNSDWNGKRGAAGDDYGEFFPSGDESIAVPLVAKMQAAVKAVRGVEYLVGQSFQLYTVSGAPDDYVYARQWDAIAKPKVISFVIEMGTKFHPTWEELQREAADVGAALVEFCVAVAT